MSSFLPRVESVGPGQPISRAQVLHKLCTFLQQHPADTLDVGSDVFAVAASLAISSAEQAELAALRTTFMPLNARSSSPVLSHPARSSGLPEAPLAADDAAPATPNDGEHDKKEAKRKRRQEKEAKKAEKRANKKAKKEAKRAAK